MSKTFLEKDLDAEMAEMEDDEGDEEDEDMEKDEEKEEEESSSSEEEEDEDDPAVKEQVSPRSVRCGICYAAYLRFRRVKEIDVRYELKWGEGGGCCHVLCNAP
jgi:hypothetical protein